MIINDMLNKQKMFLYGKIIFIVAFLLSLISISSEVYGNVAINDMANGSFFAEKRTIEVSFFVNETSNCTIKVNSSSIGDISSNNITSDINNSFFPTFPLLIGNHSYFLNISCLNNLSQQSYDTRNIIAFFAETGLSIRECPQTLPRALILGMFIVISLVLLSMALAFNNAMIGIFGALCLVISGIHISPCGIGFGFILVGLGIILLVPFAFLLLKGNK